MHAAQEDVMNHIRTIRRLACILAGLATAVLASAATIPAAFAIEVPAPGGPYGHTVTTGLSGGMAGWQITLIALGAALAAATLAVVLDRAVRARRRGIAHPA
jgi:hypothetical protein